MTTSPMHSCTTCGRQYNKQVLKKCPVCATTTQYSYTAESSSVAPSISTSSQQTTPLQSIPTANVWSTQKISFARNAASSASTVDTYGQIIQIVGYIVAAFTFLFFLFVWGPENDTKFLGFIVGIIVGALTAWGYQVVGALYRMIANYVLFRTTQ